MDCNENQICVKVQGNSFTVPVPEGATVNQLRDLYKETIGKSLEGMKLYDSNLQPLSDDDRVAGDVTAVRDKHQSNSDCSETQICVKVQGNSFTVPVPEGATVTQLRDLYQDTIGKSLEGMKLYDSNLQPLSDDDRVAGDVTAVRDKHQSNSDCNENQICVKVQGNSFTVPVPEGATVAQLRDLYQDTIGKSLEGMKLYDSTLQPLSDDDRVSGDVTAVRDKHQSNS